MQIPTDIIVALIGLAGSAFGAFIGVLASAKLTNYRIEQLEKKVDKHNTVIERTYKLGRHRQSSRSRLRLPTTGLATWKKKERNRIWIYHFLAIMRWRSL